MRVVPRIVAGDEGFRLYEPAGERAAAFCRLEHVVPWAINEGEWAALGAAGRRGTAECASAERARRVRVLLVRHRGEHRIPTASARSTT